MCHHRALPSLVAHRTHAPPAAMATAMPRHDAPPHLCPSRLPASVINVGRRIGTRRRPRPVSPHQGTPSGCVSHPLTLLALLQHAFCAPYAITIAPGLLYPALTAAQMVAVRALGRGASSASPRLRPLYKLNVLVNYFNMIYFLLQIYDMFGQNTAKRKKKLASNYYTGYWLKFGLRQFL